MKKTMKVTASLSHVAGEFPSLIETLERQITQIAQNMDALKKAGLVYATPHWREGKYFYLLHPQKPGQKRNREYVGCDPQRIEAAKQAIARAKQYDEFGQELSKLQYRIEQVEEAFMRAKRALVGRW